MERAPCHSFCFLLSSDKMVKTTADLLTRLSVWKGGVGVGYVVGWMGTSEWRLPLSTETSFSLPFLPECLECPFFVRLCYKPMCFQAVTPPVPPHPLSSGWFQRVLTSPLQLQTKEVVERTSVETPSVMGRLMIHNVGPSSHVHKLPFGNTATIYNIYDRHRKINLRRSFSFFVTDGLFGRKSIKDCYWACQLQWRVQRALTFQLSTLSLLYDHPTSTATTTTTTVVVLDSYSWSTIIQTVALIIEIAIRASISRTQHMYIQNLFTSRLFIEETSILPLKKKIFQKTW